MKLLTVTALFLISLTKLYGQQSCCIQRVLLTPTSTVYVNVGTQSVVTPVRNQQYDAPTYQNPYGIQSQQQGSNSNTFINGAGPVVASTQKSPTTITSFEITNAVPWNGNQTGYADDNTLRQILRDQELNGENNNSNVNTTSQSTTQNLNQYYQGANAGWGNTNTINTFDNSNNLSTTNTTGIDNNWTTSSSQNGSITNTTDITTNEFSDSGYIQISGSPSSVDMTESGKAIEDQTPYQSTTNTTLQSQQIQEVQSSSPSTGVYHNSNSNFSSVTSSSSSSNNNNNNDNNSTVNNNGNIPIVIPLIYTTNNGSNQQSTTNSNVQEIYQTTDRSNLQSLSPTQSTLSYINDNTLHSSTTNPSITTEDSQGYLPSTGVKGEDLVDSHDTTVVNISSSTFEDADIAPTTNDSDYKYSSSGYISVDRNGDNVTTTNQSGNGITSQQTTSNNVELSQSTQSTQNEGEIPIRNTQNEIELSTQPGQINGGTTLSNSNINGESTLKYTNTETVGVTSDNINPTTISSTLLRDSTQNNNDNIINTGDSFIDTTTISQNGCSKNTGFVLSFILILLFIMFN